MKTQLQLIIIIENKSHKEIDVEFGVNKVALGQVFRREFGFPPL